MRYSLCTANLPANTISSQSMDYSLMALPGKMQKTNKIDLLWKHSPRCCSQTYLSCTCQQYQRQKSQKTLCTARMVHTCARATSIRCVHIGFSSLWWLYHLGGTLFRLTGACVVWLFCARQTKHSLWPKCWYTLVTHDEWNSNLPSSVIVKLKQKFTLSYLCKFICIFLNICC